MTGQTSIAVKNIYYMLSYAFQTLETSKYQDLNAEEFDNIHNLFAAILAKGMGRQLKQGLYREYVGHHESLTALRGKIDFDGSVRAKMARRQELVCEYDELSVNNLHNRILKTTALLLMRHGRVDAKHRDDLKKALLFFSEVDVVDPKSIGWSGLRYTRNSQSYRMLLGICQLVVQGMLLTTDRGEQRLMTFLDEQAMSRLYEKFIFEYYSKECLVARTSAPFIKWALDDDMNTMLPTMQSDVVLSNGKRMLIIDAKYYSSSTQQNFGVHRIHSSNLYQIFTYVKNKAEEQSMYGQTVSGLLLYARTDQEIQPNHEYAMSGNKIGVRTLDLNQPFALISQQLDEIANRFFRDPSPVE